MRRAVCLIVLTAWSSLLLAACAVQPQPVVTTPRTYQGAGAGGAVGAVAGALIDRNNRWRGAVLGGALGALLGGSLTEISTRAAREAVAEGRPVSYQSQDGWQRVDAIPHGRSPGGCRQVQERVYQNGQLVREQMREVC